MSNVWFLGDLHAGHKNIHKFRTQFESEEEHFRTIRANYASVVTKRDRVFFMGDTAFTIANKDYDSWEDVISECQGMYGIAPEDLFDTTKPFNLDAVVDQLVGVVLKESFENVKTKTQFHEVVELCKQNLAEEFLTWYSVAETKSKEWNDKNKGIDIFWSRSVDYFIDEKFEWEDKQDVKSSTTSSFVDFYLN